MKTATIPENLRPKGAAEHLGVGIATVWRWAATRADFPRPIKLSSNVTVFKRTELDDWVRRQALGRL